MRRLLIDLCDGKEFNTKIGYERLHACEQEDSPMPVGELVNPVRQWD